MKAGEESHWDCRHSANPLLVDLAIASTASDMITVQITPTCASETPTMSHQVIRRLGHTTCNASWRREMVAVEFLKEASRNRWP
jgi:hypothetical protein